MAPPEEKLLGKFMLCLQRLALQSELPVRIAILPHIAGTKSPFETARFPFSSSSIEHWSSSAVKYQLFALGVSEDSHWHFSAQNEGVRLRDPVHFFEAHPCVLQFMRLVWWSLRYQLAGINRCAEAADATPVFDGKGHHGYKTCPSDNWKIIETAMDNASDDADEVSFNAYMKELASFTIPLKMEEGGNKSKCSPEPLPPSEHLCRIIRRRCELGVTFKQHELALVLLGSNLKSWRRCMFRHGLWEPPVHYIERVVGFFSDIQSKLRGHYEPRANEKRSRHYCDRRPEKEDEDVTAEQLMDTVVLPSVRALHSLLYEESKLTKKKIDLGLVRTKHAESGRVQWSSPEHAVKGSKLVRHGKGRSLHAIVRPKDAERRKKK